MPGSHWLVLVDWSQAASERSWSLIEAAIPQAVSVCHSECAAQVTTAIAALTEFSLPTTDHSGGLEQV